MLQITQLVSNEVKTLSVTFYTFAHIFVFLIVWKQKKKGLDNLISK